MGYGHWSMVIKINANIFVYPFSVIQILTLIFNNKSGKESLVHMKKNHYKMPKVIFLNFLMPTFVNKFIIYFEFNELVLQALSA